MKVILLGAPGAGKGTQARYVCEKYDIPLISTGDMLRAEIAAGTDLGKKVKATMDAGHLVSDEIIIDIIKNRIKQPNCEEGFLFDGFPRTIPQAEALHNAGIEIDFVIEIAVDDKEIIKRLTGRRLHPESGRTYHVEHNPPKSDGVDDFTGEALIQRDDDKEHTVRNRLQVYYGLTKPVIEYYQKLATEGDKVKYIRVNGNRSVNQVRDEVFAALV